MFYKVNRVRRLQVEDETFAQLIEIRENGDLLFRFLCAIDQVEAVKANTLAVDVTLFSKLVFFAESVDGVADPEKVIDSILERGQNAKMAQQEQEKYVIGRGRCDVTAKISNTTTRSSTNEVPVKTELVYKPVTEVRAANEELPNFQQTLANFENASDSLVAQQAAFDMLTRLGQDPASVTSMTHRSMTSVHISQGLLNHQKQQEYAGAPASVVLLNRLFTPKNVAVTTDGLQTNAVVAVLESVSQDFITLSCTILIPKEKIDAQGSISILTVDFDLIDSTSGVSIDTVSKQLDLTHHILMMQTPKIQPRVNIAKSPSTSRVCLEVTNQDPHATFVRILRRTLFSSINTQEGYEDLGTYPAPTGLLTRIFVDQSVDGAAVIYRVVALNAPSVRGFEFSSAVIKPTRYRSIVTAAVIAQIIEQGIEIEIRNLPIDVASLQVVRRDMSLHETTYTNVGNPQYIDDLTRSGGVVSVLDVNVKERHLYQYAVRLSYFTGLNSVTGASIIEYTSLNKNRVVTTVSEVSVTRGDSNVNVTFNINSLSTPTSTDVVLELLKQQGLKEFFDNELFTNRDLLKDLIAHRILRTDLLTGACEDFGIITEASFDDNTFASERSIAPLQIGRSYRYEIIPLLRSTETLFQNLERSRIDSVTNRSYTFQPSKFLHPLTLKQGIIVSTQGATALTAKLPFAFGDVGSRTRFDVSFENVPARVTDASAYRFNDALNVVTWHLEGDVNLVDHFLLLKEVNNVRTLVGRSHGLLHFGVGQFLHSTTQFDKGVFAYIIIPIYLDFTRGSEVITNSVAV